MKRKGTSTMNIKVTERAKTEIEKRVQERAGYLKLFYDMQDCGCAGGVPELQYVKAINEKVDRVVETDFGTVLVEESQQIFFGDDLTIDFSEAMNTFQLKSPGGILNPVMRLDIQV